MQNVFFRPGRWAGLLSLAATLVLPTFAQTPPSQGGETIIRTTTRIVQVGVVVKDKDGRPVSGLSRKDFTITDGGKEQAIQLFSVETNQPPDLKKAVKLAPGTLSNRAAGFSGVPRNLTAILIDALNTKPSDWQYAFGNIVKFLSQMDTSDHVAIFSFGTRLVQVQDFTNDSAALLAALKRIKVSTAGVLSESAAEPALPSGDGMYAAAYAQMQQVENDLTQTTASFAGQVRAEQSLKTLQAIAGQLAGTPGRKNLIWVCGDFPIRIGYAEAGFDPRYRNLKETMDRTAREINVANVAVYPVDAAGLLGVTDTTADQGAGPGRTPGRVGRGSINATGGDGLAERIGLTASGGLDMHAAMNELAEKTGGRAFYNTNNIYGAIRSAADDAKVTYMLAYSPTHNQWNGNFREIKVKVNRPGVELLYRKGYLAVPDLPSDDQTRRAALGQAAASTLTSTALGLKITPTKQGPTMILSLEMDVHEIGFEQKDGKYEALVDLLFVMRDAGGAVLDQMNQPANLSLSPEDYHKLEPTGIGLRLAVPIPAGTAKIRVVARDNSSGQIGSIDIPVAP
jgi:VWFA-related protein